MKCPWLLRGAFCVILVSLAVLQAADAQESALRVASIKLVSEQGSTRSTRYSTANKIVTIGDKTHVAWLDSVSQTMIATYEHASGEWTPPVKLGDGKDNHGGPALTCDSQGYLHVFFGPHHGPFQYARSKRPNDASEWTKLPEFGDHGTYPSAVCDSKDMIHLIYRGRPGPCHLLYQRLPKDGNWSEPRSLAHAGIEKGYTHYHSALAIASNDTLHVSYDIYAQGAAKCAGHMMSRDGGDTWLLADGQALALPVTPKDDAFFERTDTSLGTGALACDSKGNPWINMGQAKIWHHDGTQWHEIRLDAGRIPELGDRTLSGLCPLSIDAEDRVYVPALLDGDVVIVCSEDGGKTFQLLPVFSKEEKLPHTGVNIERFTGHNRVGVPWVLFATGEKGPDCFGHGIFQQVRAVQFAR